MLSYLSSGDGKNRSILVFLVLHRFLLATSYTEVTEYNTISKKLIANFFVIPPRGIENFRRFANSWDVLDNPSKKLIRL